MSHQDQTGRRTLVNLGASSQSAEAGSLGEEFVRNLFELPKIQGIWYHKKSLTLDGYSFVECRFDACQLHILSSNFQIINCFIDPQTTVIYGPDMLKPIRLFNMKQDWMYSTFPFWVPYRDTDGKITVR